MNKRYIRFKKYHKRDFDYCKICFKFVNYDEYVSIVCIVGEPLTCSHYKKHGARFIYLPSKEAFSPECKSIELDYKYKEQARIIEDTWLSDLRNKL